MTPIRIYQKSKGSRSNPVKLSELETHRTYKILKILAVKALSELNTKAEYLKTQTNL